MSSDNQKKQAALAAVEHVRDGFVVGLGSGTTAAYAIMALGQRIQKEKIRILGIPSSYQAFSLAVENKIPITTLDEHPVIDVNIDGADQVDPKLNLIKGMGAALLREKIVATSSKLNIIIADYKKKVEILGQDNQAVPVEVFPFALSPVKRRLEFMGGIPVLREGKGKLGPIITDNGNAILDTQFCQINQPEKLEKELNNIPGVIENGIFTEIAHVVYLGTDETVEKLIR